MYYSHGFGPVWVSFIKLCIKACHFEVELFIQIKPIPWILFFFLLNMLINCTTWQCCWLRQLVPPLTLELRFDLPGMWGKAPKNVSLCVFDKQQVGTTLHQAAHHAGEALSMQPCGKHKSPGSAVAVWQLKTSIEQMQVGENKNRDKQKSSLKVLKKNEAKIARDVTKQQKWFLHSV